MQTLHPEIYILLLIICAVMGIIWGLYAIRQRKIAGSLLVGTILLLSGWFALTYAFSLAAATAAVRLFWIKLEYITIVALVPLSLVFCLRFTGRNYLLKRRLYLALLVEPLIVILAVWTMPLHSLYYQSYRLDIVDSLVTWNVTYGPLYWLHTSYSIALYVVSLVVLLIKMRGANHLERRQILFILFAVNLGGMGGLMYTARVSPLGYDHSALLSVIGGAVVTWFVLKSRVLEMGPIAIEGVLQSMGDGVLLLDQRWQVVSLNPAAVHITGLPAEQVVAAPLAVVLPELAARLADLPLDTAGDWELELGMARERRIVAVRLSPLREDGGQIQGRLLLLRDISEARQAHQSLVEREAELRQARNFLEKIIATAPLGIGIYDLKTSIFEFANPVFARNGLPMGPAKTYTPGDLVNLFYPDDPEHQQELVNDVAGMKDGDVHMMEYRHKRGEQWAWTRIYYAIFERDSSGAISKILAITSDFTDYKNILENLAQSEARYRSLFEGIPIGLYRVTHDGWLLEANPGLVQILGYPDRESLMAHNVLDFYINPADRVVMLKQLAESRNFQSFEYQWRRCDGEVIWVSNSPRAVLDLQGQWVYEGSIEDITHRKNVEASLQNSEEKFRDMFNMSPNLVLLVDVKGKILDCNLGVVLLDEQLTKAEITGQNICRFVAQENQALFLELMQDTLEEGGQFAKQVTMLRNNGQHFPAEVSTSPIPDPAGARKTMVITISDISQRKEAEARLQDTQQQLAQRVAELELRTHQITLLTELSNMLQVCLNPTEAYGFVGRYGALLFPRTCGQLMMFSADRKQLVVQAGWGQPERVRPAIYLPEDCWALRSGQPYISPKLGLAHLCKHFAEPPTFGSLCAPILSEGQLIGVLSMWAINQEGIIDDAQMGMALAMAEQIGLALSNLQLHENLRELAIRDPLTGLYNRYYLRDAYENAVQVAQQNAQPVAIVMMDLDHFKAMNTHYGHVNTDTVLAKFGALLREFVANGEVAFRYGGDEFVLILPNATPEMAAERINLFRKRVSQLVVQPAKHLAIKNLTVSVGISSWPAHGHSLDELLQVADTAMFQAKEQRDRVQIAGG